MELAIASVSVGNGLEATAQFGLDLTNRDAALLVEVHYTLNIVGATAGALLALLCALTLAGSVDAHVWASTTAWMADERLFGRGVWTGRHGAGAESVLTHGPVIVPLHGLLVGRNLALNVLNEWDATTQVTAELYYERVRLAQAVVNRLQNQERP